jgi:hypothetical protein
MYSQIVHIIIIVYVIFNVKVTLNIILTGLFLNLFVAYFYEIKVFKVFHLMYHKFNGGLRASLHYNEPLQV